MCSATGQSQTAGVLTNRVPVLFSCLTGKYLWLKSHLVCSYQKKLRSFTGMEVIDFSSVLTGTFVGGLLGLSEIVQENFS